MKRRGFVEIVLHIITVTIVGTCILTAVIFAIGFLVVIVELLRYLIIGTM